MHNTIARKTDDFLTYKRKENENENTSLLSSSADLLNYGK